MAPLASESAWKPGKAISPKGLVTLPRTIAISSVGVALLATQIAGLESKCISMLGRIKIKQTQRECKAITGRKAVRQSSHT
jgi:hypothetical protein